MPGHKLREDKAKRKRAAHIARPKFREEKPEGLAAVEGVSLHAASPFNAVIMKRNLMRPL
jgi:hypothetical protein